MGNEVRRADITAKCGEERVRERVEASGLPGCSTQPGGRITTSAGVASLGSADRDVEALVQRAHAALYAAKQSGRDRVVVARPQPETEASPFI